LGLPIIGIVAHVLLMASAIVMLYIRNIPKKVLDHWLPFFLF